ncbi:MAG: hypothetical protein IKD99_00645 [Erysipelotrichaceae bacterium]|nr:hypothetical protein [Erysipelotrichaceae bacterium]MBR2745210.1 hypothetical protein [Erysipelotrichaceae bacterium]
MKKDIFGAIVLQLFMGAVLIVFGIVLNAGHTDKNASLAFLLVPGVVIIISTVLNFFKYQSKYFFPVAASCLCFLGDIIVMTTYGIRITAWRMVGILISIVVTALICTLFHWLHGEIIK